MTEPSSCECCRFRSEASLVYDPVCAKSLTANGTGDGVATDTLVVEAVSGLSEVRVTAGSGAWRLFRGPHPQITSNSGWSLSVTIKYTTAISGGDPFYCNRPTIGKQRVFAWDWCLELDWSDETLRAYTCDEKGEPIGAAWYEQVIAEYWNARNFLDDRTVELVIQMGVGTPPTEPLQFVRFIALNRQPVAYKTLTKNKQGFWYGASAEHLGDDMVFSGFLLCIDGAKDETSSTSWYCQQLPFIYSVDTSGFSLVFPDHEEHFPYDTILIPDASYPDTNWTYFAPEIIDGGDLQNPLAQAGVELVNNGGLEYGILFALSDTGTDDYFSDIFYESGASYSPKDPKPAAWDCDETSVRVLNYFQTGATTRIPSPASITLTPVGLTTPASPP